MKNLTIERTVDAPRRDVWAVLADYPNIAAWNDGVKTSTAIGDAVAGVGAVRRCELDGNVSMRETVTEWTPESTMAIAIDEIEKMPVNSASMTFRLAEQGERTGVTMRYDYAPKGGPLSFLVAAMMGRPMQKGFNGFVDHLERAAQARSAA